MSISRILFIVFLLTTADVSANEKILIVTEDFPPYSFLNKEGSVQGIATEGIKEIFSNAQLNFDIKLMPWARAYEIAKTQPNVIIYPIAQMKSREEQFHFICPIAQKLVFTFYRLVHRDDIEIVNLEDAKKYIIGVVRDDSIHIMLKGLGFITNKNLDIAANGDITIKKLLHGRVDLIYSSESLMKSRLSKQGFEMEAVKAIFQIPQYKDKEVCLALNKQSNPDLVKGLKAAHKNMAKQ